MHVFFFLNFFLNQYVSPILNFQNLKSSDNFEKLIDLMSVIKLLTYKLMSKNLKLSEEVTVTDSLKPPAAQKLLKQFL